MEEIKMRTDFKPLVNQSIVKERDKEEQKIVPTKTIRKPIVEEKTVTVLLNCREEPNGKIVEVLKPGTKVEILKEEGEWSKIGPNRYVKTEFLK
jgi:hypothetical protein